MKPAQVRAARNWLAWTQQKLAEEARVGLSTIRDFESAKRTPIENNIRAIRDALERAGMRITEDSVHGPLDLDAEPS